MDRPLTALVECVFRASKIYLEVHYIVLVLNHLVIRHEKLHNVALLAFHRDSGIVSCDNFVHRSQKKFLALIDVCDVLKRERVSTVDTERKR